MTYDGTEQELVNAGTTSDGTMQYSLDNVTWSTTSPKGTDAGEYIVYYMVKGDSGHSDSAVANVKVTIGQKGINDSTVTIDTIPNQTYDGGNELKPLPTVKDGTTELTKDTDYTVSYDNNKNAGTNTAKLTITGQGNYTGTKDANFTIDPADQVLTVPGSTNVAFGTTLDLKTVCDSRQQHRQLCRHRGFCRGHQLQSCASENNYRLHCEQDAVQLHHGARGQYRLEV